MGEVAARGRFSLESLACPIIQAPMGGGPSTPELAAAVCAAGGLGFLAAGYQTVDALSGSLDRLRSLALPGAAYGVNVFAPPGHGSGAATLPAYRETLAREARDRGVPLGEPRWDDDRYEDKVRWLEHERVPVVSFTFGCPDADVVRRLHDAGSAAWVTVTTTDEATRACAVGADALVVQGMEAGGHRGSFDDARPGDVGLLALLQIVRDAVDEDVPLIATGGIATGRGVAAVLAAGAAAAQLGTAFLLASEAATHAAQRDVLRRGGIPTALTRAFTGRTARGVVNRFLDEYSGSAPSAYPEVHHLTAPVRAAARERGDADGFNLWAGQAYELSRAEGAGQIVQRLMDEMRTALEDVVRRTSPPNVPAP